MVISPPLGTTPDRCSRSVLSSLSFPSSTSWSTTVAVNVFVTLPMRKRSSTFGRREPAVATYSLPSGDEDDHAPGPPMCKLLRHAPDRGRRAR